MLGHMVYRQSWYKSFSDVLADFKGIDGINLVLNKVPYKKDTVHFFRLFHRNGIGLLQNNSGL